MKPRMRLQAGRVFVPLAIVAAAAVAGGGLVSGCLFSSADDCVLTLGHTGCKNPVATSSSSSGGSSGVTTADATTSSGSGGAGPTTTSSRTSTSGSGGSPECTDAKQCPIPPGPCAILGTATCTLGKCGVTYTAGDSPTKKYGSCKKNVCDASGVMTSVDDPTNFYDDGNPCTKDACTNGQPTNKLETDMPCTSNAGVNNTGVCELDPFYGLPACVPCDPGVVPGDAGQTAGMCTGGLTCVSNSCVANHCTNGYKDQGETGSDCGGSTGCAPCPDGQGCTSYLDCASKNCDSASAKCMKATCTDGRQNGRETDLDCGGDSCPPCVKGLHCSMPRDCESVVCLGAVCQSAGCSDGVQNGDETGIDCGGSTCGPCASAGDAGP